MHCKRFSLAEHAAEQRRQHRLKLNQVLHPNGSSSEDTESEDDAPDHSGSEEPDDLEMSSGGFLQPVSPRQRRVLLKAAGVRKIDASEKDECRAIRMSREFCGCNCRSYCDPETCACSLAGIKCQVDRLNFPCGCTQNGCVNVVGRVEFNSARVRTHFIHTIFRLELDNKPTQLVDYGGGVGAVVGGGDVCDGTSLASPPISSNIIPEWYPSLDGHLHHLASPATATTTIGSNSYGLIGDDERKDSVVDIVNRTGAVVSEALDLHYAYRDDDYLDHHSAPHHHQHQHHLHPTTATPSAVTTVSGSDSYLYAITADTGGFDEQPCPEYDVAAACNNLYTNYGEHSTDSGVDQPMAPPNIFDSNSIVAPSPPIPFDEASASAAVAVIHKTLCVESPTVLAAEINTILYVDRSMDTSPSAATISNEFDSAELKSPQVTLDDECCLAAKCSPVDLDSKPNNIVDAEFKDKLLSKSNELLGEVMSTGNVSSVSQS